MQSLALRERALAPLPFASLTVLVEKSSHWEMFCAPLGKQCIIPRGFWY